MFACRILYMALSPELIVTFSPFLHVFHLRLFLTTSYFLVAVQPCMEWFPIKKRDLHLYKYFSKREHWEKSSKKRLKLCNILGNQNSVTPTKININFTVLKQIFSPFSYAENESNIYIPCYWSGNYRKNHLQISQKFSVLIKISQNS